MYVSKSNINSLLLVNAACQCVENRKESYFNVWLC